MHKKLLYNQIELIESLAVAAGVGLTGMILGSMAQRGLSSMRSKHMTCRMIKDPYRRDQCTVKIINSVIETLKDARDECENTPDPAQCKYDLILKIEKLMKKKYRLEKHINRVYRAKVIDSEKS